MLIGIAIALLMTWLLLIAALAIRRPRGKKVRLQAAYRRFSSSAALRRRNQRLRLKVLVLAVLVILDVVVLGVLLSRVPGEQAAEFTSTRSATSGGLSSSAGPSPTSDRRVTPGAGANTGSGSAEAIRLHILAHSTRPFQPVQIQGTYHGGANTFLRVERWEAGKWLAFPIPTKTD